MKAFRDLLDDSFKSYLAFSSQVGDLVKTHSDMVQAAINEQYRFLQLTATHTQPNQDSLMTLLKPTSDHINAIQDFRHRNRATKWFDHLSAISESIPALGWVTVAPTPGPYVKEMTDASQFYTNKVLVAYKDKDKTHVEWAKSWIQFLTDLQKYIKSYHTTGITWNPKGASATSNASSVGGVPPPPPPPLPSNLFTDSCQIEDTRSALLRDLNKGSDITKGLRKITADQQTHKNPSLRAQGSIPYKAPSQAVSHTKPVASQQTKPPRFELEGRKWKIEYQVGQKQLVVQVSEMSQSVNIYQCKESLIMIKGKVNSITVDSCNKTSIVFDDVVSVVEFVNCQSIKAQVSERFNLYYF